MFFYELIIANKFCKKKYIYSCDKQIKIWTIVSVEFGFKQCFGLVINESLPIENSKKIIKFYEFSLNESFIKFIKHFSEFNYSSIGSVLELVIPSFAFKGSLDLSYDYKNELTELRDLLSLKLKKKEIEKLNQFDLTKCIENKIELHEDQIKAIKFLKETKKTCLLKGVTGSGKTIVALESITNFNGKILILVPEINLANNWIKAIKHRFGKICHMYHSKMKDSYKKHFYTWALSNKPGIIVGTRSALMIPYRNLSKIIIDEEHSYSYKQENYPYYNAKDMAILRGVYEKFKVLLLSATPSMETYYNVCIKKYDHYNLLRVPKYGLAKVNYVKGSTSELLAPEIIKSTIECFEKKQQVLFFLNRKGYVPYCICNNCKTILTCKSCDCAKTFYKNYQVICHKCLKKHYLPKTCNECNQLTTWRFFGIGVEKINEYLMNLLPNYTFSIVTCDTEDMESSLNDINENKVNGIIATQVLAQGHDFKNIGLVVVVDADMGVSSTDFRALEKMYQLWQQIRGRSGRHDIKGQMLIQYFKKDNRFIELFQKDDVLNYLLNDRKKNNWPPFSKCAFLKFKGKNKEKLEKEMSLLNFKLTDNIFGPLYYGMKKNIHEFRFLVKSKNYKSLFELTDNIKINHKNLEIEVDPYSF